MPSALLEGCEDSPFEAAEQATDAAFVLHDRLYAYTREDRLAKMLAAQATATTLIDHAEAAAGRTGCRRTQARIWYLRGKAAACGREGHNSAHAERLLGDAVKLEPTLVCAWNALGECYWQRGDLEEARGCFIGALAHEVNATSLCHLSMLLRMHVEEPQLAAERILESLDLAKEAVRLEPCSPKAWSCLGCALLSSYAHGGGKLFDELHQAHRAFVVACKSADAANSVPAYADATKATDVADAANAANATDVADPDPDLLMNHALAHFLLDDIDAAIACYGAAHALDPTLGGDARRQEAWEHACHVQELLQANGGLRDKRLAQLLAELPPPSPIVAPPSLPAPVASLARLVLGANPRASLNPFSPFVTPHFPHLSHPIFSPLITAPPPPPPPNSMSRRAC